MGGDTSGKLLTLEPDESLGAPRVSTPRKTSDRSGFQQAAGRILDDCAKLAAMTAMSVPLTAYLREPLSPLAERGASRITKSMPLWSEVNLDNKDIKDTDFCRGMSDLTSAPEDGKTLSEDDPDDTLYLDGAEQLMCHTLSNGSCATSSALWKEPEQSVIIIDWDDTLFPTSWLAAKPEFKAWQRRWSMDKQLPDLSPEDLSELAQLDQVARSFVTAAAALGQVCCVTLSRSPWQQNTMKAFLPNLARAWEDEGIQVVYASDAFVLQPGHMAECRHSTGLAFQEKEALLVERSMKKKEAAMRRVIRKAYNGKSWKNVVSIGDGEAEFDAMRDMLFKHVNPVGHTGDQKSFRMKAVQMLDSPECSELITQLQILQAWMPALMCLDDDFFVTLHDGEEDILAQHQLLLERLAV